MESNPDLNGRLNCIWLIKSYKTYRSIKGRGANVVFAYSIQGLYELLTASCIFVSHGVMDVVPYLTRGARIVSLGHVIYPIKNMSYVKSVEKLSLLRKAKVYCTNPYSQFDLISYEVVASDYTRGAAMFEREKSSSEDYILALGQPKTDYLLGLLGLERSGILGGMLDEVVPKNLQQEKLIIFLPTWRQDEGYDLFSHEYDNQRLNGVLKEMNAFMLINFHPFDESRRKINSGGGEDQRVFVGTFGGEEIAKLLCTAEMFITDYSSLYCEFLLQDRPIIFAKLDHEGYVKERELLFDYQSLPGAKAGNWNEIEASIVDGFSNDLFKASRKEWKNRIYAGADDGRSCERIAEHFCAFY